MEDGRPVKIATFWSAPQAELARMHLAMEGIRARLGNAALLSWCWHFGNAVGGVTLYVAARDVERSVDALDTNTARSTAPAAKQWASLRPCTKCGELSDDTWQVCWDCGTSIDGTEDPTFGQQDRIAERPPWIADGLVLGVMSLLTAILFLLTRTSPWVLAPWVVSFPVFMLLGGILPRTQTQPLPGEPISSETGPVMNAAGQSRARRRRMGEAITLRAWRASMFGFFVFPPLILYSVYLLMRLDTVKTPLGRLGRCRCAAAWVVSAAGILLVGSLAMLILGEMMGDPYRGIAHFLYVLFGLLFRGPFGA